jgi:hypothetical protein
VEGVVTPASLSAEFGKRISLTILSVLKETKGAPIKADSRPMTVGLPRYDLQSALAAMLESNATTIHKNFISSIFAIRYGLSHKKKLIPDPRIMGQSAVSASRHLLFLT